MSQHREKPALEVHQKQITVYSECAEGTPVIYLPVVMGDGSEVYERCRELDCPPFALVAIGGLDWNRELSPWECDGTIRDAEPFGGQASEFLDELLNQIIPEAESSLPCPPTWRGIAGYSLAGLLHCGHFGKQMSLSAWRVHRGRCGSPALSTTRASAR